MTKKRVTEALFDTVKQLQENGLTNRRIAILLEISEATVSRILKCDTFADYKSYAYNDERALLKQMTEQTENHEQAKFIASYAQMEHMNQTVDAILDVLKRYLEV